MSKDCGTEERLCMNHHITQQVRVNLIYTKGQAGSLNLKDHSPFIYTKVNIRTDK